MFDNIYTEPSYNAVHTNFNGGNTQWIILELDEDSTLLQQSFIYKFNGCELSGPSIVCNTGGTFSISNIPYGVILSWNKSSNLSEDSSGVNYVVMKAIGSGEGWVQAQLSGGGTNVFSEQKTVWVGGPKIDYISGPAYAPNYQWATYYAQPNNYLMAATDYEWILNPLNGNSVYDYGWTADIAFYNSGYYQVVARAQNTCGWGSYAVLGVEVYDSKSLSFLPNPTTGETTLTIETNSSEKIFDETAQWDLEIYSPMQALKTKKTRLKGKSTTIQTAGWTEGVYMVRVKYQNEVLTGKLVVKR
ncbi:MAG TPA: T9SS type A sorting domain-containing protein [Mariniphaga anaerophila]|uniref:T9SS type A sorting domain-containing protein n=1 Tax=Mariniphaga anaerophila TaxID=1484053 RepID=A0A831LSS4_9BACT|nr:T9SS type A sorting domain-containing protein [Mariniphaga anaerophila]